MENSHFEKLKKIFENNNGIAERTDFADIHYRHINKLLKKGTVIRLKRGLYQWIEGMENDEIEILFKLLPESILSMESALHYYGYTDRTPDHWTISVNRNINKNKLKIVYPPIKPYYVNPSLLELGLTEGKINQIAVRVYNKERTICDILRYVNKMDREIVNKAIQAYIKDPQKNVSLLLDYGKKFKISKRIQTWLGVWF